MIIKIFAILVIILLSVLLGYVKTTELSCRYSDIKSLIDALALLEGEIKTKNSELYDAFYKCAQIDNTGLFGELAVSSETDGDFMKLCDSIDRKLSDYNAKSAFLSFVTGLGAEDTDGQLANIKICKDRLMFVYNNIGSNIEKLKRIYFLSFALCGVAIGILFI